MDGWLREREREGERKNRRNQTRMENGDGTGAIQSVMNETVAEKEKKGGGGKRGLREGIRYRYSY